MTSPLDTLSFHRATRADAAAIERLVAITVGFSNAYEYDARARGRIVRLYSGEALTRPIGRKQVHVARDAKGLAGMVSISPARGRLNVDGLFVHPEMQGLGLGSQLLAHGLGMAATPPLKAAAPRVTVLSSLTAEGFYARHGFDRLREVPRDYGLTILMSRS